MKISDIMENSERPELVIMVGLPASGKSTVIKQRYPNHTVVSSDDTIERLSAAEGMTYDEGFKKFIGRATGAMKTTFRNAIKEGENIVWDQTNLSTKKRRGIIQQTPEQYRIVAVVFDIPERERERRVAQRPGKTIPDHVMKSMAKSFNPVTKDEGFDEIIEIRS